jgi:N-acetylglutamate synthase-like GNAT family acetyltransferase
MQEIDFHIRPARKSDQTIIRQLIRRARLNPMGISWPAFDIVEGPGDMVLGCGQVKRHRDGSMELASLYIAPEFRGQGIAAALIQRLQSKARSNLWLTCRSDLIPFYARFAFTEVADPGEMPTYFRRVWRLFWLFKWLVGEGDHLAVMYWGGTIVNE